MWLWWYVYPPASLSCLVLHFRLSLLILLLRLPCSLQIEKPLLPPSLFCPLSWPPRHSSIIRLVAIYWVIVFWRRRTYVCTSSSPASGIVASKGYYSHHSSVSCCSCIPSKMWANLWWNTPRVRPVWGVHHPGLWYKQEVRLNDRLVKRYGCLGLFPLPA